MLQQLLLSPPHLPVGLGDFCQGGSCCSGGSNSCCEDQASEVFFQQACCLAASGERACGRCAAYAQLLRLRCDSSPSLCASSPSARVAAFCHAALPKSDGLERASAAAAAAQADRQRCTAAAAAATCCCCCCLYYDHCSSSTSSTSSEPWESLPSSLAEDLTCEFGAACASCVALKEAPSPLDAEDEEAPQLWGPEEEAWGLRDCWAAPSRCTDTGGRPEHEMRAAAAGVGALLLQLPSNLICDAALLSSALSPLNTNGGPLGPLPPSRVDVAAGVDSCCQQRRGPAHSNRSTSTSTCCCFSDSEVYRHCRGEAMDDLVHLESNLLQHNDGPPVAAAAAVPPCCETQQHQQPELKQHFEQLSPLPMSSCASRCASPLQQVQPEQHEPQLLLQHAGAYTRPSSVVGESGRTQAAGQQQQPQSLAAGRKPRVRRRRTSDTPGSQRQQQQQQQPQPFAGGGCCCGRLPCACPQPQQQHPASFFAQKSEVSPMAHHFYAQQQQELLVLPVQKRKRLTGSTLADSSCDEWTVGAQDQWPCDGPVGPPSLLLSSEQQQKQQLSPDSYYEFSCSPSTATTTVQQQHQHQQPGATAANCSTCGAAAKCCCCGSLGLEQQQQHLGLHSLVESSISRQLSQVSHDSVDAAAAATADGPSKDFNKDPSSPSAAASPKGAAPPVGGGGPFVCSVDIRLCLPQFEDSADCLSLLKLTEAQWQQFRAQGMFKLGDKGRAIIKSRISRQLRVFPHLRKRASSVAGVRCATTKQLFQLAQICGLYDVLPPQFQPDSFRNSQHEQQQQQSRQTSQQREQQEAAGVVTSFTSVTPSASALNDSGPGGAAATPPAGLMLADFDGTSPGGSSSSSTGFWQPVLGEQQQLLLLESMQQQQSQQQVFCDQQQLQLPLL